MDVRSPEITKNVSTTMNAEVKNMVLLSFSIIWKENYKSSIYYKL